LKNLRHLGFDSISIGTESGDDDTLAMMNKGYTAHDIIEQCKKLEEANIRYNLVYLTGLAGKDKGERNAVNTANVFNQLHPFTINFVSLTVFPESELYGEIQRGNFVEATEHERLLELRTFISELRIETTLLGNTVSNTVPFVGMIPNDKVRILNELTAVIQHAGENELRQYRDGIKSL
ncbi:radical SAM protein, partial [Paraprevotella clara]|uniref:radical SAM protein n=1 Tax=Paraprevotella clara TaxID=454154 RepID=UPI003FF0E311